VVPGVAREHSASIVKGQAVHREYLLFILVCLTLEDEDTRLHQEPLPHYSVIFQKAWILRNTAVRTENLWSILVFLEKIIKGGPACECSVWLFLLHTSVYLCFENAIYLMK